MAKRPRSINPRIAFPEPFSAEEQQERYKKNYEFNKQAPVRSPVSGWEQRYVHQPESMAPPKEIALVKGVPHSFKGRRDGNSYGSRATRRKVRT